MSFSSIASVALTFLGLAVSLAQAQQVSQTASIVCTAATRGTVNCPTYTSPATTAVPRAPMDGSTNVPGQASSVLFNGAVPPNGFMIEAPNSTCFVNDNGPAMLVTGVYSAGSAGFLSDQMLSLHHQGINRLEQSA